MSFSLRHWGLDSRKYVPLERITAFGLWIFFVFFAFAAFALIDVVRVVQFFHQAPLWRNNPHLFFGVLYILAVIISLLTAHYLRKTGNSGNLYLIAICHAAFLGTLLSVLVEFLCQMFFARQYVLQTGYDFSDYMHSYWEQSLPLFLLVLFMMVALMTIRWRMCVYRLSVQRDAQDTSGNLGAARMADENDISRYGLRGAYGGLIGKDAKSYLRLPRLTDRLILAYRGGGKTAAVLTPFILDYLHVNKFLMDIKGELAAVTARKAQAAGRKVKIIDPFRVLEAMGIHLPIHGVNPLAHIPHDQPLEKDRYITALASAICSSESAPRTETEMHFSENAQIILEGVLDFYLDKFHGLPEKMNLVSLHDWWLDIVNDSENNSIKEMQKGSHKARAAAAQLGSAGKDESGSMKTTVYRQLQWLRSENIRECFLEDSLELEDFIKGNSDIYVVLPEDMIKSHSRMVRVIMALIKVKLIQASSLELKEDYCFVLDELGQFGYSADVEQMINTMRSRGVKVWASFQTIGQIEVYKDEAVFKGMPVKHFLGSDDIKTLKWIQELGDKTTVLTENVSRNISSGSKGSRGSISESYSVSETATDLIHFNDVREMSADEQYVFIKGMRPIRCQKAYYYQEPIYEGRYDPNPLEERTRRGG